MPFIVHAAWLPENSSLTSSSTSVTQITKPLPGGNLFLWAEDLTTSVHPTETRSAPSGLSAYRPQPRNGNGVSGNQPKAPSHPHQATVAQLRSWLNEALPSVIVSSAQPRNSIVHLPTLDGLPTARRSSFTALSPKQERTLVVSEPRSALQPWQVTGLALPAASALTLLSHLGAVPVEQPGRNNSWQRIQHGKDLQFWSHAAKFVLETLVGQQYLPAIRSDDEGNLRALWQPVLLDGRLQEQFEYLVAAMPPVCRSYNLLQLGTEDSAQQLTEHFIATLVDAAVRQTGITTPQVASSQIDSPVVNQWMRSLTSSDQHLRLPPQMLFRLFDDWRVWQDQLQISADALFRVAFVLEAPPPSLAHDPAVLWTLHYELQACDNTALRVTAREVWQAAGGSLRVGSRRLDQPQDRLLAGLGAASRLFDPIAISLRSIRPESSKLTSSEAYQFLREIGPLLDSIGFGVYYPDWWSSNQRSQLGLRLRLASATPFIDNDDESIDNDALHSAGRLPPGDIRYSWELTLGAQKLSQNDFERIAGLRTPLLWLDNRWVELDPAQISAARRFIGERAPSGRLGFLQALRLLQGVQRPTTTTALSNESEALRLARRQPLSDQSFYLPTEAPASLPLQTVDIEGWLVDVIEQLRNRQPPQPINEPPGFIGELRPYQRRGVGWLHFMRGLGIGACLADDMGLGKTIQAIALFLHERQLRQEVIGKNGHNGKEAHNESNEPNSINAHMHTPALIICPTSVIANWRREVERFAPSLRVMVHHGNNRLSSSSFVQAMLEHDVLITSYGTARRDVEMLQKWTWTHLVLDEAQNIKNPAAKQSQAVRSLGAQSRIALTGTPVENRLSELWSILDFLNPGYLESFERFRQRYVVPIERYNDDDSANELRQLVQPFFLRRVKSDPTIISDLPEKLETVVYCSLSDEQAQLYEKTVRATLEMIDNSSGIQRRGQVLALLTKLKQIANHPAHFLKQEGPLSDRSGKLDRLTEMLEEAVEVGDHALIFTQFVEMGTLLQRHLSERLGVDVLFLHGGTTAIQRDRMVQAFQSDDGPPIFVLSLRAGGSGLNLTRANHVFHFDRWWNPAVENQATDRAFRIGQKRNVLVHKFVAVGTLEERIQTLLESKQALADAIVGSGEDWLTELSTDELREMLMLRHEMVEEL